MDELTKTNFIASELEASRKREQQALRDLDAILHPPKQHFFEEELEKNIEEDVYYTVLTSKNPRFYLESMAKRYGVSLDTIEEYGDRVFQRRHGQSLKNIHFQQMLDRILEIKKLPDPGQQLWELQELARRYKRSVRDLMSVYDAALQNQPKFELLDALDVIQATPEKFDWLVAGLLPMATTALLYAEGGTGKTLLANSIIKAVTCGLSWNGFPTKHGKVLLMQTDEPAVVTAQNLKVAEFQKSLQPGQLLINHNWQFSQMQQLREAISAHQAMLVVIDSLTSSNRNATAEEKDVEYGRCLYELRDIAMEFGCAILILHHENKIGGVRGSTAIKANVSEVWHLTRDNALAQTQRVLEVEKSRSGCSGQYLLQLDVDDYSWQHQGDFDPTQAGTQGDRPPASLPLKARLLNFLEERPGIPFEPEELVSEFSGNRDAIRKTLDRLWRSGLVQFEERTKQAGKGTTKYKVYLVPEVVQRSEPSPSNQLGAGQPNIEALDKTNVSSAKSEVVQRSEPSPSNQLGAGQPNVEARDKTSVPKAKSEPVQRSEPSPSNQLGAGQPNVEARDKTRLSNAKSEPVQRSESSPSNQLGAGQPNVEALDKTRLSNAKSKPVQRSESPTGKESKALDKTDSGIPLSEKILFKVGDRVVIVMPGSKYKGQAGTVRRVVTKQGLTSYTVQPDSSKARIDYQFRDLFPAS